jgi:hypothetical protein
MCHVGCSHRQDDFHSDNSSAPKPRGRTRQGRSAGQQEAREKKLETEISANGHNSSKFDTLHLKRAAMVTIYVGALYAVQPVAKRVSTARGKSASYAVR